MIRTSIAIVALATAVAGCGTNDTPPAAPATPATPPVEASPTPQPEPPTEHAITSEVVTYQGGGAEMKGYLAYPTDVEGPVPGVLVVHEFWGLNDYARSRADQLARLGFAALAVDMYGGGKSAEHPDDARAFASAVRSNMPMAEQRLRAAYELLAAREGVDGDRIAAIGYCFGGGVVLHAARVGMDLDAVASFHGGLASDETLEPGEFDGKILVLHGGADQAISAEQVAAFEQEMKAAGADYEVHVYEDATHAFTNPDATATGEKFGMPVEYHPEADRKSWNELLQTFAEIWPANPPAGAAAPASR